MDTLYVGSTAFDRALALIAQTRAPYIAIRKAQDTDQPLPRVMTKAGVVFGAHAVLDFLLTRFADPQLVSEHVSERSLQMTVFYALLEREAAKLTAPTTGHGDIAGWQSELKTMLSRQRFYVGAKFTLCDAALAATIELIPYERRVREVQEYLVRVEHAVAAMMEENIHAIES